MQLVNISLDIFAIIILFIILISTVSERIKRESRSFSFPLLILTIILTLFADLLRWIGEGNPDYATMTLVGSVMASCFAYFTMMSFMFYLMDNVYNSSKAASVIIYLNSVVCLVTVGVLISNIFNNEISYVDAHGHIMHRDNTVAMLIYLIIPIFFFISIVLMTFITDISMFGGRIAYLFYGLLPITGAVVDYFVHGWSITYFALVICAVILYTHIYLQKRRIISEQRTALMLSQINPHFMYNTLTAIASLCDIDPKRAKDLTIDFSSYLRQNIGTLSVRSMIPFEQELKHIETYLKIEKARFGDKVNVIYSIQSTRFSVPPLTIQPLVENAVKHGITKKAEGGTIKIVSYTDEQHYIIDIIDDGVGFDTNQQIDDAKHVGINNVRTRLMYSCNAKLEVKSKIDVGTRFTVRIPKRKAKSNEDPCS